MWGVNSICLVTGLSRGYGFITYESRYSARKAYDELNQSVLDSHVIFVDYERNRTMKGWVPRRLGGGFGGRKQSGQLRFGARDRPFRTPSSKHISSELKRSTVWKYL